MITGNSSAHQFSTPGVNAIGGVSITRLPSGAALGATDLTRWSSNRSAGRSGAYTTKDERQILDNWTQPSQKIQAAHKAKRFSKTERLAFYQTKRETAVALGILVEQSIRAGLFPCRTDHGKVPSKKRRTHGTGSIVNRLAATADAGFGHEQKQCVEEQRR
jgi:hypothetical protein